ncbi:hemagglutinin repeat-containing protein [Dyella jiangningensis]
MGAYAAAHRGSEVKDDRLKALYAAQAAYGVSDAVDAYNKGGVSKSGTDGGINLQLGIGASSASSKSVSHDETAYGSTIKSNGNVLIAATDGDLNVIGSKISGDNVALSATNNINLLSQSEDHTLKSSNKNASGGVGVQIGTDGIGFYAQASVGKGSAHGNGTTHATTSVDAKDTLTLVSGGDTTLQGAQAKGNTVLANIGGNLNIISEQDTDDYASKQQQASGKLVVGVGASGSGSYNQSKVDSHYASVTTVSGIGAGDGGFNIHVNGNTDLKGGVIASTADPSKNLLDTGSLTFSNIENKANYSASSVGVSGGSAGSGMSVSPSVGIPQSDDSHSSIKAGIAGGTIITRNGDTDLSGLDRTANLNQAGLKPIFDLQKVQEQQEMGQVAGYVGFRAAGDIAGKMGWAEGSPERTILHGVVGAAVAALGGGDALSGGAGAAANQAAIPAMAQYLADHGYTPGSAEFATMLQLGSAAIGGAVAGGTGAATALDGTKYNYLTHQQLDKLNTAIQECKGDRVCIESAKSAAETISANQELALVSSCGGPGGSRSDACKAPIADAFDYASDPLASKLGLQADQAVSAQDYMKYRYWWGNVIGDRGASEVGNFMVGVAAAGATAGLGAGPGMLAAAGYEGIEGGSLLQFALATRTGTALTSGGVNLSVQLAKTGGDMTKVNPIDVGASVIGGYLGYGGGVRWNGLVGFGVGVAQTEANNLYGGQNNSLLLGGVLGSATTAIGFRIGDGVTDSLRTPVISPISAVLWGNVIGPSSTEGMNWGFEKLKELQDNQKQATK